MRPFLAALHFLTILPLPGSHAPLDADWRRATAWYPAVGLVVGTLLAGAAWGLGFLWPGPLLAAVVLALWAGLTGALHLDGFSDCCDALFAPVSPERRLEILRDVHAGTFAIAGVVLLLLVKFAALLALPQATRLPGLLLVPALGRWAMTAAVVVFPYARRGPGLGRKAKEGTGWRQLAWATATALVACGLAGWAGLGWAALAALVVAAGVLLLAGQWIWGRLGGLTGDAYGAICELVEVAGLLLLAGLAHQGLGP